MLIPRSDLHMKNIHGIEENAVNGSLSAIIENVEAKMKRGIMFILKRALQMLLLHARNVRYDISRRGLINILCTHTRLQEA